MKKAKTRERVVGFSCGNSPKHNYAKGSFFIAYVRSQTLFTLVLPLLYSGAPDGLSPEPWWEFISRSHVIKSLSKVFENGDDRNCL